MVAVHSVAITNRKKVQAKLAKHIRNQNIGILVLLVRVSGLVAHTCSKSKFGYAVKPFCGNLNSQVLLRPAFSSPAQLVYLVLRNRVFLRALVLVLDFRFWGWILQGSE